MPSPRQPFFCNDSLLSKTETERRFGRVIS